LFGVLAIGVILPVWGQYGSQSDQPVSDLVVGTVDLGKALVDQNGYVLPFEVASLLLTAAMIGAIVIARDDQE
jgi:NADH:ubiquinone oxidoreductase subunit 6 (subunit J)